MAARDADYKTFAWYPETKSLDEWGVLYQKIARANGGEPNAGRYLQSWAWEAGFSPEQIQFTWSHWLYQNVDALAWGDSWQGRALHSGFAETAKKHNFADDAKLQEISQAWKDWSQQKGAFIAVPAGEILCRK